jgi:hypothetical protein
MKLPRDADLFNISVFALWSANICRSVAFPMPVIELMFRAPTPGSTERSERSDPARQPKDDVILTRSARGPELIEADQQGNVVHAWGGPGYHPKWPTALQTVIADTKGFVWISGEDN